MWSRLCSAKARLIGAGFAFALVSMASGVAPSMAEDDLAKDIGVIRACAGDIWRLCPGVLPERIKACVQEKMAELSSGCLDKLLDTMAGQSFKICKDQTYALCAAARCNVYDGVAYCQCEKKTGDSISLAFQTSKDEDVCSAMAASVQNQYLVSTYSLPNSIVAPQGDRAIYNCPGGDSAGAYAQCDGGLCFAGTEGAKFLGFDQPVPKGQIICACPISGSAANSGGYGLLGPYPCQKSFFQYCKANTKTGSTMYVGAPAGTLQALTVQLNGKVPPLNECSPSGAN